MSNRIELFQKNGIDEKTRTMYLGYGEDPECDVDEFLARQVVTGICILDSESDLPINIIMNCQGGYAQHGFAIYDAIQNSRCPVIISVYGHCYSMAVWILQAATTRRVSKNSSLMIHDGPSGRLSASKNWKKFYREEDDKCRKILLDRIHEKNPDFRMDVLKRMLRRDTLLWPEEALSLGLVDEII